MPLREGCFLYSASSPTELTLAKLATGDTPPQSLTVSIGVKLKLLASEWSSPTSHGGGAVETLGFDFARCPFGAAMLGIGGAKPPPFTPRLINLP